MPASAWRDRARAHAQRADAMTSVWREAHERGEKHAIEDFLFTYYPTRPGQLRRWHAGPGAALEAPDEERLGWRWYRTVALPDGGTGVTLDVEAFLAERGDAVRYVRALVGATASRPGTFGSGSESAGLEQ